MDGFLNVLKPPGMTSHDVVAFLRKKLNIKKIGHLGTLDPGAAGVLPISIGKATRLSQYIFDLKKSYRAEITFGFSTDTLDKYGNIVEVTPVRQFTNDILENVIKKFEGNILQIPPIYSAKKINGKKLYEYARAGKEINIKPSTINIYEIKVLSYEIPYKLLIDVKCSKGTYIRALVRDICKSLSVAGYMSMLIRTSVGLFNIDNSYTLEDIKLDNYKLLDMDSILSLPSVYLDYIDSKKIMHGQCIENKYLFNTEKIVKLYNSDKMFIGIGNIRNSKIYVERLLFGAEE
ncbi:tRNA pseudouridine(55) synthase TruB [Thermoanaerobacterium sp. RBIITD]|uniref:tRNA pseudouridine(55) synthase TruB n=1 Tax=Thermoanaerobacterium sp. RBIITD TaxID=1550240 RepID=UPI000BB7B41E|nr:tRNA pseudouridine(55) synthase TruB [Thermoanaerobacterium sp. RBIITD]SNX55471.1 tRNA pseudouridine55 synthase [Thermoanaerobacterium sp. RBIITD]